MDEIVYFYCIHLNMKNKINNQNLSFNPDFPIELSASDANMTLNIFFSDNYRKTSCNLRTIMSYLNKTENTVILDGLSINDWNSIHMENIETTQTPNFRVASFCLEIVNNAISCRSTIHYLILYSFDATHIQPYVVQFSGPFRSVPTK